MTKSINYFQSQAPANANARAAVFQGFRLSVCLFLLSAVGAANAQTYWSQLRQFTDFAGIAFGQSNFVAVGTQNEDIVFPGIITTSTDGVAWTLPTVLGDQSSPNGVVYGNGQFVVVGNFGNYILTSPDGSTWTWRSSPTANQLRGVCFGAGIFVAVGDGGAILTSTNGIAWTARPGGSGSLYGVAYGNGIFVVVGSGGTLLTSPNGQTWSFRASNITKDLHGVSFGTSNFVAVASSCGVFGCSGAIIRSSDGISWSAAPSTPSLSSIGLTGVGYGAGRFVAVGHVYNPYGDDTKIALVSTDGNSWTQVFANTPDDLNAVAYGNNKFVAVGTTGTIVTSPDGTAFAVVDAGYAYPLQGVAYGNGVFVLAGGTIATLENAPQGVILRTRNPGTSSSSSDFLYGATFGNGLFVVVGGWGTHDTICTSTDAVNWTAQSFGTSGPLYGVAYGANTFVAVGNGIFVSTNGINWQKLALPLTGLNGVTYGNGQFIAVGTPGVITSPDGVTWSAQLGPVGHTLYGCGYGMGTYVVVGSEGTILTTPDFVNWRTNTLNISGIDYHSVAFGQGYFVVAASDRMLYSSDGVTWVQSLKPPTSMLGVAYGHNTFVAVGGISGRDGTILLSGTGIYRPRLTYYRSGESLVFSWVAWANEFQLESTPDLGPQANWTAVTNPVVQTGYYSFTVTNGVSGGNKFYRLRQM